MKKELIKHLTESVFSFIKEDTEATNAQLHEYLTKKMRSMLLGEKKDEDASEDDASMDDKSSDDSSDDASEADTSMDDKSSDDSSDEKPFKFGKKKRSKILLKDPK
jgi:hypothetical protein